MLALENVQLIDGVSVYGDHQAPEIFYVIPQTPRFRIDERGRPVFRFLKYRTPVDRPDGARGGGFVIFDAELVVPEDTMTNIRERLENQTSRRVDVVTSGPVHVPGRTRRRGDVQVGAPVYVDGAAQLNLLNESEQFIDGVFNPGQPSLFGAHVTPFSAELTPEGATLLEQGLQGEGGGIVQIAYSLTTLVQLPPLTVRVKFEAERFYSYVHEIETRRRTRLWGWLAGRRRHHDEQLREELRESGATTVEIDPGGVPDEVVSEVRDWAHRTLERRIAEAILEDVEALPEEERAQASRRGNVEVDIEKSSIVSFQDEYTEGSTIEWDPGPRGTLPNITALTDADGDPVRWEDHAEEVDLDDDFFRQKRVDVHVNADFENLPINSVEVRLRYQGRPMTSLDGGTRGDAIFHDADRVARFGEYVEDDVWDFTYGYRVNYRGTSQTFDSDERETDRSVLTVSVDDVGILLVDVTAAGVDWSDVDSVQVRLRYEDTAAGVEPVEERIRLTEDEPDHRVERIIFAPTDQPYRYRVTYFMADGREYESEEHESRAPDLFVNNPFSGRRTIRVVGVADFEGAVDNIFVDLEYVDAANDYRQESSVVLNAESSFHDWSFPVLDADLGEVVYSGHVVLRGGEVREIERTTTDSGTILVPRAPEERLEVQVVTDLLDFDTIDLVRVEIAYGDDDLASVTENLIFSAQRHESETVEIPIFDRSQRSYEWSATYFLGGGESHEVGPVEADGGVIILDPPA